MKKEKSVSAESASEHAGRTFGKRVAIRLGRIGLLFVIVALIGVGYVYVGMVWMPGDSFEGELPTMTEAQGELAAELRGHVQVLGGDIGARNVIHKENYARAREYLRSQFESYGYEVEEQVFVTDGVECANLAVEVKGGQKSDDEEIIVIGAHYDGHHSAPAANDNGSGTTATLALAKRFYGKNPQRTIRFVLFANEEPPYFLTDHMGSLVYAKRCKQRNENIIAMISLETIGYYSAVPGSQKYPVKPLGWFYPTAGDYIGIVGNLGSRSLTRQVIGTFRAHAQFPSQGAALPGWIPGVGWSDQWAFWQMGYPAVMVTDTAVFRYPEYHTINDLPEKLDYARMARVVEGMEAVVRELAEEQE